MVTTAIIMTAPGRCPAAGQGHSWARAAASAAGAGAADAPVAAIRYAMYDNSNNTQNGMISIW